MNNGPYFFATGRGVPWAPRKMEAIARKHGADFVTVRLPDGPQYWAECPNRGCPFDRDTQAAVETAWQAAGLMDKEGFIARRMGGKKVF